MMFDAKQHEAFFDEIREEGFHIFSRECAKRPGYYPTPFPGVPEFGISDIHEGDTITIRAFFPTDKTPTPRIDSGLIDLEVEYIDHDAKTLFGNILTELPTSFALAKGTSIELGVDEVLFVQNR
jgi:hypothetical protein